MISVDLRGRRLPVDSRTHVFRLNDWPGSTSYVQGARRDPGDTPMPEGETRRYVLTQASFDGVRRLPGGTVVELPASQVGPQHDMLPDETYPEEHAKAFESMHRPRGAPVVQEMISLAEHQRIVQKLEEVNLAQHQQAMAIVAKLEAKIDALSPTQPMGVAALPPEAQAEIKEAAEAAGTTIPSLAEGGEAEDSGSGGRRQRK